MTDSVKAGMDLVSRVFEGVGVAVILGGFVFAAYLAVLRVLARQAAEAYRAMRDVFGRSILLGLEVLVAGDLIRTVAVSPSLNNVAVLASLVVLRTFLSWSLEVEIDGRWPWQRASAATKATATK